MTIHSILEGNVIFANYSIGGDVQNTNISITGDVINNGMRSVPAYQGVYEVTPNASTQVLSTSGTRMEQDVVINPIPSNYGRIEWNGSVMTII